VPFLLSGDESRWVSGRAGIEASLSILDEPSEAKSGSKEDTVPVRKDTPAISTKFSSKTASLLVVFDLLDLGGDE